MAAPADVVDAGGPGRESDYAKQLRAKQKARRIYGIYEAQFRRYYGKALKARGITGLMLLQILESRLDNVIFRLGFASSRAPGTSAGNARPLHGQWPSDGHSFHDFGRW